MPVWRQKMQDDRPRVLWGERDFQNGQGLIAAPLEPDFRSVGGKQPPGGEKTKTEIFLAGVGLR